MLCYPYAIFVKLLVLKGLAPEPHRLTVKGHLLKSASVIALVTVISRICGYLRDQRVALLLGTSPAADSLVLVFRIPNLIRRLSGEGALGAAFIPVFTGYLRDKPRAEAWSFAQKVFWDMAAILGVLAVLGVVFARQVIYFFTILSQSPAQWDLAVFLGRIIIPAIFFVALAGIAAADAQQLSGVRIARGDADIFQSGLDFVFAGGCVPADDPNGTASVSVAGGRDCVCEFCSAGSSSLRFRFQRSCGRACAFVPNFRSATQACRKWAANGTGRASGWVFTS